MSVCVYVCVYVCMCVCLPTTAQSTLSDLESSYLSWDKRSLWVWWGGEGLVCMCQVSGYHLMLSKHLEPSSSTTSSLGAGTGITLDGGLLVPSWYVCVSYLVVCVCVCVFCCVFVILYYFILRFFFVFKVFILPVPYSKCSVSRC